MAKTGKGMQGSVSEVLREYVIENFLPSSGLDTFKDDDSFMEKGIFDSTGVLELLEFIEDRFDIMVDDEEIIPENLDSLHKLTSFINKKKENAS